ncbi:hypothetical protein BH20ACT3_BH20ACT3_16590 [soil metagenome]
MPADRDRLDLLTRSRRCQNDNCFHDAPAATFHGGPPAITPLTALAQQSPRAGSVLLGLPQMPDG